MFCPVGPQPCLILIPVAQRMFWNIWLWWSSFHQYILRTDTHTHTDRFTSVLTYTSDSQAVSSAQVLFCMLSIIFFCLFFFQWCRFWVCLISVTLVLPLVGSLSSRTVDAVCFCRAAQFQSLQEFTTGFITDQTHIYILTHTHTYIHMYVCVYKCAYIHTCIYVYIYIYIYLHICMYADMYIYTYAYKIIMTPSSSSSSSSC